MSVVVMEDRAMEQLPVPRTGKRTAQNGSGSTRLNGRTPGRLGVVPATGMSSGPGSSPGTRRARPVTMPESREMARLYDVERWSFRQIAEKFGRSRTVVRWHVRFHGVKVRSKAEAQVACGRTGSVRVPMSEVAAVAEAYARGLSLKATADAVGLGSPEAVANRLAHSEIGVRSHSQAMLVSTHPLRLSDEKVARVLALHGVMGRNRVAAEVGVSPETVAQVWLRNGLDVPGGRKAAGQVRRRPPGNCGDEGVLSAPLFAMADRVIGGRVGGWVDLATACGVDSKLFRAWRTGELPVTHVDTADRVLVALDVMWWEVFDPGLAPAGEEDAWLAAYEQACKLWGEG